MIAPRTAPVNPFRQIRNACAGYEPACVFDIGANVGQTVGMIRQVWPAVPVHAFEPVSSTFETLRTNTAADPALTLHRLAFGMRPGKARMLAAPQATMNRIVTRAPASALTEEVDLVAGDRFCAEQGIGHIGVLKIDTEGHDLEVIMGFRDMLADRRIDFVEAECAIAPDNTMHVPLQRLADVMFSFGYGLFGLYTGGRYNFATRRQDHGMRYGNALFIAEPWPEAPAP